MPRGAIRVALASLLFAAWVVLLMTGFSLGGWVHLLLVGALLSFPWRESR